MYCFTLTIDAARTIWSNYTRTPDYKRAAQLYYGAITRHSDGASVIEQNAFSRAMKDSAFDSFFPLKMRDTNALFAKLEERVPLDDFLRALEKAPYTAYLVLTSAKPITVSTDDLQSVQNNVRQFDSDYLRRVNLPNAYTQKQINPYRVKLSDILNDIANVGFFCNPKLLTELTDTLLAFEKVVHGAETDQRLAADVRDLAHITATSFDKRQRLFGTPRLFSVTWQSPHLYRRQRLDDDTTASLMRAVHGLSRWVKANVPKYTKQSTVPLVSAIGSILYDPGTSPENYVRDRVLLGWYGYKYNRLEDLMFLAERVGKCFSRRGFDNPFFYRPSGIRAMHARKKWPIIGVDTDVTNITVMGWTLALQARLRLIFPENQVIKLAFKFAADTLKDALLKHFGPTWVDLVQTDNALRAISENYYKSKLWQDGLCLCATDASGFDSSESKPLQDIMYEFMRITWPELPCSDAYQILHAMQLLIPNCMASNAFSYAYDLDGQMTASGEVFVTAKNNLLHALMYIAALSDYYHEDPYKICCDLHKGKRFILKLMGDDNARWLGDDPKVYAFVDKFIEKCGIVNAYEQGTMFLKRMYLPSLRAFTVDYGSLAKNLSGEYARQLNVVVGLGATARAMRGDSVTLPWTDAFRRILNVYLRSSELPVINSWDKKSLENQMRHYEQLLVAHMTPAMLQSTDMRHILESMFYSNGEQWPTEQMEGIYGMYLVNITEKAAEFKLLNASREQLADLICDRQEEVLDHITR